MQQSIETDISLKEIPHITVWARLLKTNDVVS